MLEQRDTLSAAPAAGLPALPQSWAVAFGALAIGLGLFGGLAVGLRRR